jgi:hypothetical protein
VALSKIRSLVDFFMLCVPLKSFRWSEEGPKVGDDSVMIYSEVSS